MVLLPAASTFVFDSLGAFGVLLALGVFVAGISS
jgi:hypothetical protein